MILPLRIRHRRVFTVLGVVLPVAFGLGIAARKPVPQMNALPAELQAGAPRFNTPVWARRDLFTNAPIEVRLLRDSGRFAIACTAPADFVRPDLLVYWSGGEVHGGDLLPKDAVLLGAFSATALPLPADAAKRPGVLVLFSLADQEVVAVSRLVPFNSSTL